MGDAEVKFLKTEPFSRFHLILLFYYNTLSCFLDYDHCFQDFPSSKGTQLLGFYKMELDSTMFSFLSKSYFNKTDSTEASEFKSLQETTFFCNEDLT